MHIEPVHVNLNADATAFEKCEAKWQGNSPLARSTAKYLASFLPEEKCTVILRPHKIHVFHKVILIVDSVVQCLMDLYSMNGWFLAWIY